MKVKTANASATAGSDYTGRALTTLTFGRDVTTKYFVVNVTGDTLAEADETFQASLTAAENAVISDDTGVATIVNDEPVRGPSWLSVDNISVTEGNVGATTAARFTVTRSGDLDGPATVKVATAVDSALAPPDYTALASTVTFAADETSKAVTVSVIGDVTSEPTEKFTLNLSRHRRGDLQRDRRGHDPGQRGHVPVGQ